LASRGRRLRQRTSLPSAPLRTMRNLKPFAKTCRTANTWCAGRDRIRAPTELSPSATSLCTPCTGRSSIAVSHQDGERGCSCASKGRLHKLILSQHETNYLHLENGLPR